MQVNTKKVILTALVSLLVGGVCQAQQAPATPTSSNNQATQAVPVNKGKLVFAETLIRHGDRTPYELMKNPASAYKWKLKSGDLTPLGMQEEYQLGTQLRQRYVTDLHLLPANYEADSVLELAGAIPRLILSVDSLNMGLYPAGTGPKLSSGQYALPQGENIIPVQVVKDPNMMDAVYDGSYLKLFQEVLKNQVETSAIWKEKNQQIPAKDWDIWSKIAGYPIHNLYQAQGFFDNLNVRYIHHIPFPKGIDIATFKKYNPLVDWSNTYVFSPTIMGDVEGGPILKSMTQHLAQAIKTPDETLKYVIYGGHDVTISGVLSALGVTLNSNPPYASHVNIELYKESNNTYQVEVSYNNQAVNIPACHGTICTYKQFTQLVQKIEQGQQAASKKLASL